MPSRPTCTTRATAEIATRPVQRGKVLRPHKPAPWRDTASVSALRKTLDELGLGQAHFGRRLDTDERTVHYWLEGQFRIPVQTLERDPEIALVFAKHLVAELQGVTRGPQLLE